MNAGLIFLSIVISIISFLVYAITSLRAQTRSANEELGESPADTDFVIVNYKGERLPMTMMEKLTMWDYMDRGQKREASMAIKKGIKKGKLSDNLLGRNEDLHEFSE